MVRVKLLELLQLIFFWFGIWSGLTIKLAIGLIVVPGFINICSDGFSFIKLVVPLSEFSNLTKLWSFDGTYSAGIAWRTLCCLLSANGFWQFWRSSNSYLQGFQKLPKPYPQKKGCSSSLYLDVFFPFSREELQRLLALDTKMLLPPSLAFSGTTPPSVLSVSAGFCSVG